MLAIIYSLCYTKLVIALIMSRYKRFAKNSEVIMTKQNITNRTLAISLVALLMVVVLLSLLFTGAVYAATQMVYTKLGDLNYLGRDNKCYYDIILEAYHLDGNVVKELSNAKVVLQGVSCKRNIFTTFTYDFTYTLFKDGVQLVSFSDSKDFKITKQEQVYGHRIVLFDLNKGFINGKYTIHIVGEIRSNVTAKFNKSVYFEINV